MHACAERVLQAQLQASLQVLWLQGAAGRCRALRGAPVMSLSVMAATLESFLVIARFSDLSLQP